MIPPFFISIFKSQLQELFTDGKGFSPSVQKDLSALKEGDIIEGRVVGRDGAVDLLDYGGQNIRARSRVELPKGAKVRLRVTRAESPLEVKLEAVLSEKGMSRQSRAERAMVRLQACCSRLRGLMDQAGHTDPDGEVSAPVREGRQLERFLNAFGISADSGQEDVAALSLFPTREGSRLLKAFTENLRVSPEMQATAGEDNKIGSGRTFPGTALSNDSDIEAREGKDGPIVLKNGQVRAVAPGFSSAGRKAGGGEPAGTGSGWMKDLLMPEQTAPDSVGKIPDNAVLHSGQELNGGTDPGKAFSVQADEEGSPFPSSSGNRLGTSSQDQKETASGKTGTGGTVLRDGSAAEILKHEDGFSGGPVQIPERHSRVGGGRPGHLVLEHIPGPGEGQASSIVKGHRRNSGEPVYKETASSFEKDGKGGMEITAVSGRDAGSGQSDRPAGVREGYVQAGRDRAAPVLDAGSGDGYRAVGESVRDQQQGQAAATAGEAHSYSRHIEHTVIGEFANHVELAAQLQHHLLKEAGQNIFIFPLLFSGMEGVGQWSFWKETGEGQTDRSPGTPDYHVAFDLYLKGLGQLNIHLFKREERLSLLVAAEKEALPVIRQGLSDISERIKALGFRFESISCFSLDDEQVQAVSSLPFDFGEGSRFHLVT